MACRFVIMHNPNPPSGLRHNAMPSSGMLGRGRLLVRLVTPSMQKCIGRRKATDVPNAHVVASPSISTLCSVKSTQHDEPANMKLPMMFQPFAGDHLCGRAHSKSGKY